MTGVLYAVLILGIIGLLAAIILSFASLFFAVKTDEKAAKIREALPGANCGACGYTGCDGYAAALAEGKAEINLCVPGASKTVEELSEILGVNAVAAVKKVAFVRCNHGMDKAKKEYCYSGADSCMAASLLNGGPLACKYGCIGYGDCVKVCEYGAIDIVDGTAKVDKDKCIACGKCASVCPKHIISIIPCSFAAKVECSNKEKGAVALKECGAACIGCKKCENTCKFDAITVNDNLALVNPEKCTSCGECVEVCPKKCIHIIKQ